MGTVARQKHLQWKIPFNPWLKDVDNSSGQEKCALKYVLVRGRQKKIKRRVKLHEFYKILIFLDYF